MTHVPLRALPALTRVGKALADPTRCSILLCLLDGPHYPTELAEHLGLTKANVSNHLGALRSSGLVSGVPEGRRVRYTLVDPRLAHALADLAELTGLADETADVVTVAP